MRQFSNRGHGFTLVELLVVIAIIGLLMALLLPAISISREMSRQVSCTNNMRQLALGVLNYESARQRFPPSAIVDLTVTTTGNNGSWGVHGRILPFLEEANLYQRVDIAQAWDFQTAIDELRIPVFQCPSDRQSAIMRDPGNGKSRLFSTNYGFNMGTWFVFDPSTGKGGDGVFFPNSRLKAAKIADGLSKTIMASEVAAWTHYKRNGGPPSTAIPTTAAEITATIQSGAQHKSTGHTEWPDGRVHHTGFTATLTPNFPSQITMDDGSTVTADYNSWQEGKHGSAGHPTYAIVTARSHHTWSVSTVFVDGSVHTTDSSVDLEIWRAAATRNGQEVLADRSFR